MTVLAMRYSNRIAEQEVGPPGQLAEPARRDKELAMRLGFWKLFSGFALHLVNPLGVPSLDPRLPLLGIAPFTIPARSMAPTLEPGDVIIVSAWPHFFGELQRGDLVVFLHPQRPDIKYVKRLIVCLVDKWRCTTEKFPSTEKH